MQFKSVTSQKYVSAENGGGMNVTVDRDVPSSWETFRVRCFDILYPELSVRMHLHKHSRNNVTCLIHVHLMNLSISLLICMY